MKSKEEMKVMSKSSSLYQIGIMLSADNDCEMVYMDKSTSRMIKVRVEFLEPKYFVDKMGRKWIRADEDKYEDENSIREGEE